MQAYCRDDVLGFNLNLNLRAAIVKNEKSWSLKCVFLRLFLCSFVSDDFCIKIRGEADKSAGESPYMWRVVW